MKKAPEYAVYHYECCEGTWPGPHTPGCKKYEPDPRDQEIANLRALVTAKDAALDYMTGEIKKIIEFWGETCPTDDVGRLILDRLASLLVRPS